MAVLEKPVNKLVVVKADDTKIFIDQFINNKVDQKFFEFLQESW